MARSIFPGDDPPEPPANALTSLTLINFAGLQYLPGDDSPAPRDALSLRWPSISLVARGVGGDLTSLGAGFVGGLAAGKFGWRRE